MATRRMSILNWAANPDETGRVFLEPFSVKGGTSPWDRLVLIFDTGTTRDGVQGGFHVPQDYVGSPQLVIVWTTTAISGTAVFDFDYRAVGGNDAESLDASGTQESVEVSDVAPNVTLERMEVAKALTAGNFAAGDDVEFEFFRDQTDATITDDLSAAAILFELLFEYSDA